jgi:DNA-binding winged helix-turn-helix (wHTH) protein/TolB-like protein
MSLFRFGAFEVDVGRGEIRKHGLRIKLHEKSFLLLAVLLERPGEVVSHEDIRRRLWPADVFVDFDRNLYTILNRLRQALGDTRESPQYVETVHRKGYRFIAPVETIAPPVQRASAADPSPPTAEPGTPARRWYWLPTTALLSVAVIAVSLFLWSERTTSPQAAGHSGITIGVLLFENLTGDPSQDYLSCGLTQEILVELSRLEPDGVTVKAWPPGGHFATSTEPRPAQEAGLVADYLLEGGVRSENGQVRVSVELVEARTGQLLWAQRLVRDSEDLATSQEGLAREIAEALSLKLATLIDPQTRSEGFGP